MEPFYSIPHVFSSMESRAKFINIALAGLHQHYELTHQDIVGRLDSLLSPHTTLFGGSCI